MWKYTKAFLARALASDLQAATPTNFSVNRWIALSRYDTDVSLAADALRPYGEQWVERLGRDFFELGEDKLYLPAMVAKLKSEAEIEAAKLRLQAEKEATLRLFRFPNGEVCSEDCLEILLEARARGYQISHSGKAIAVVQGTWVSYLYNDNDIRRFAKVWFNNVATSGRHE